MKVKLAENMLLHMALSSSLMQGVCLMQLYQVQSANIRKLMRSRSSREIRSIRMDHGPVTIDHGNGGMDHGPIMVL